jgi:hypothetical protein
VFIGFLGLLTTPVPAAQRRLVLIFAGVLFVHPMVWYYTNEARPYAMIFAGACVAASGLLARLVLPEVDDGLATANGRLIAGMAIMAGTSVIGVIWSIAFLLPALGAIRWQGKPSLAAAAQFTRGNLALTVACGLVLLPIGFQYAWSFLHGVSATAYHENSLLNFAFGVYEIAGFDGIGPGREELRAVGAAGLKGSLLPLLAYGVAVAAVLVTGLRCALERNRRQTLLVLASAFIPLAILFILGTLKHWRVVGRHMMPLVLFFALFVAYGIVELLRPQSARLRAVVQRGLAAVAVALLAASSLEIAYAERHRREDFRAAAQLAGQYLARNDRVWWVAQSFGADYYHLPLADPALCAQARAAVLLESPGSQDLANCPEPQEIFIGRYDTEGAVQRYATEHHFRKIASLTGFEILAK